MQRMSSGYAPQQTKIFSEDILGIKPLGHDREEDTIPASKTNTPTCSPSILCHAPSIAEPPRSSLEPQNLRLGCQTRGSHRWGPKTPQGPPFCAFRATVHLAFLAHIQAAQTSDEHTCNVADPKHTEEIGQGTRRDAKETSLNAKDDLKLATWMKKGQSP